MARLRTILVVLCIIGSTATAAEHDVFQVETEGSYRIASGESTTLAKQVAMFNARMKAVETAGRYLSRNSLIMIHERYRDEIYSLTANEIQAAILEENWKADGKAATYRVRIRAAIQASDFVKAEIEDSRREKEEAKASYREEMEQPVADDSDPGRDIAKAYRLLREKKWRITLIYLDNLEIKYPNWDRIYMARAVTHYMLHEPVFMEKALRDGCRLGNTTACDDLKDIKKLQGHDFGLSAID
jgi:hypothetical protein